MKNLNFLFLIFSFPIWAQKNDPICFQSHINKVQKAVNQSVSDDQKIGLSDQLVRAYGVALGQKNKQCQEQYKVLLENIKNSFSNEFKNSARFYEMEIFLYYMEGKQQKALELAEAAIEKFPNDLDLHFKSIQLFEKSFINIKQFGLRFAKAEKIPSDLRVKVLVIVAASELENGKINEAKKTLTVAKNISPFAPELQLWLAIAEYEQGNLAQALQLFRKSKSSIIKSQNYFVISRYLDTEAQVGDPSIVVELATDKKISSQYPLPVAKAHLKNGDEKSFISVLTMQNKNFDAQLELGKHYISKGQKGTALSHLKAASKLNPQSELAKQLIKQIQN